MPSCTTASSWSHWPKRSDPADGRAPEPQQALVHLPAAEEETAARAFENAYGGTPTWEIGRPQGALVRLCEAGQIVGSVLDVGCGTGDTALYLAARGHHVLGVDFAPMAVARAAQKAAERGLAERTAFIVRDVLRLGDLGRTFDTIVDIGLFHSLQPADRTAYAASLRAAIIPGGRCFVLCWSDRNPFGYGPERVSRTDLLSAFEHGWRVGAIDDERLETRLPPGEVHAWLARLLAA
jgi:SAM-dependent methyltransferase